MSRIIVDSGRKMGEECGGKQNWKENMYWSHFQTVQFFRTLTGDYHHQLAIPEKFVKNLRGKLAGDVTLRSPSGVVWIVGITTFDNTWYFKSGWKEFVEDHSLQENDVLIFKYSSGNSMFDVVMFDNKSLCEKEGAYFVGRCVNEKVDDVKNGDRKEGKSPPPPAAEEVRRDNTRSARQLHEANANKNGKTKVMGEKSPSPPVVFELPYESSDEIYARDTHKRRRSDYLEEATSGGQSLQANAKKRRNINQWTSKVSEEVKQKFVTVLDVAAKHAQKSEASFAMALLPSQADGRANLTIPARWVREYLKCRRSQQYKYVILQVEEKKWKVGLYEWECGRLGISKGFKSFVQDNHLQVCDNLVFKLVAATEDTITFNIRIFRVAAENIDIKQEE